MLKEIFNKPQWKHRDPEVRVQAIAELSGPDREGVLDELIGRDPSAQVRREAVIRIQSLDRLAEVAKSDADKTVREAAADRLRQLLTGVAEDAPGLEARLEAVGRLANESLLEFLARSASDPQIREAALGRVSRQKAFAEAAARDASPEIRRLALERIDDEALLENVVRRTRKHDKNIHRLAQQKLDSLRLTRGDPATVGKRREELCHAAEVRAWSVETAEQEPTLEEIAQEWRALPGEPDPETARRFRRICRMGRNAADEAIPSPTDEAEVPGEERLQDEWLQRLEAALENLRTVGEGKEAAQQTQSLLEAAEAEWDELQKAHPTPERDRRYRKLSQELRPLLALDSSQQSKASIHSQTPAHLCQRAEEMLSSSEGVNDQRLKRLKEDWRAVAGTEVGKSEEERFAKLAARIEERLKEDAQRNQTVLGEIRAGLALTSEFLDAGELRKARTLFRGALEAFRGLRGLSTTQERRVRRALSRLHARIRELKDWQHWGNTQQRIRLCEQVESLPQLNLPPEDLNRCIKAARRDWMALEASEKLDMKAPHYASGPGLWKRFHSACNQAYEPCKEYFRQRAEVRQARAAELEALCGRLETSEVEDDPLNWKPLEQLIREGGRGLRSLNEIEPPKRGPIAKRIRACLTKLDSRLKKIHSHNEAQKRGLIEQVNELAAAPTFNATLSQIREIQLRWKQSGTTVRRREQDLWKEFRAACTKVLGEQAERRVEHARKRQGELGQLRELCEAAEKLAKKKWDDPEEALAKVRELREASRQMRLSDQKLRQRFEDACRSLDRSVSGLKRRTAIARRREEEKARFESLRLKADLCRDLETRDNVEGPEAESLIADFEERWAGLPTLDKQTEGLIRRRFESARQALLESDGDRSVAEEKNLGQAELLCVRMELLAGIDSPPESATVRRRFQMSRLSAALTDRESPPPPEVEAEQIRRDIYLTGPLPNESYEGIQQRFERATEAYHEARR